MNMSMTLLRTTSTLVVLAALTGTAAADRFGGFGGREDGYLIGSDKICAPIAVTSAEATGTPACHKATADEIVALSVKSAVAVHGADASHKAEARGRTLEIKSGESVVVTWKAADAISKVEAVYVSKYERLVAVEYTARRGGRDVTDVVVFDLKSDASSGKPIEPTDAPPKVAPPKPTKAFTKVLKAARKAAKGNAKKALKAWQKVLKLDAESSEAQYGVAVAQARLKKTEAALVILEALASSSRDDAIEFLVSARFDKAFAKLRSDARFRAATGLDSENATFYVRLMGQGGKWEDEGTTCERPGATFTFNRDKTFKILIDLNCADGGFTQKFNGTWSISEPSVALVFPNSDIGLDDDTMTCTMERDGDEDVLQCPLDREIAFEARPVRR